MCHDLSFSASTVEFITDLLPNIVFDQQLDMDFSITSHVLSMSHRKCMVIYSKDGIPHANEFEWGLIADFMKTPELVKRYRIQMANCRMENILDKKSAWYRIRQQRCLVAVDGIYEHRRVKGFKNKIPYYIKLQNNAKLLLPGFYNYSPIPNPETGEMTGTFSIITGKANAVISQVHNDGENKHRMPRFMQPRQALKWIDENLSDEEMMEFLEYEIPSEELNVTPVYTIRTTKERPDGKEKYEKFNWPGLPELGNDEPMQPQKSLF